MIKPGILLKATRPAFLSVTLVAVLLGLAAADFKHPLDHPVLAIVVLLFALIAHAGGNVINDYYDAINGCDAANQTRIYPYTGGSRFIQEGHLSAKQTAALGYGLLGLVIPAGLYLVILRGPGLLGIGLCGWLAAWAYSAAPLRLQSRGLGEVTIVIAWLMVVIGTDFVQTGTLSLTPFLAGLAYALLVANVLFINQIPDHDADKLSGKYTLIVRFSPRFAALGCAIHYSAAAICILIGVMISALPQSTLITLFILLPGAYSVFQLRKKSPEQQMLRKIIPLTIITTLLFGIVLSISLSVY